MYENSTKNSPAILVDTLGSVYNVNIKRAAKFDSEEKKGKGMYEN